MLDVQAPVPILAVWQRFAGVPMETLTKAWWLNQCGGVARQRTVAEMRGHRESLRSGGNCFDLALWLIAELEEAGVTARPIGHGFETPRAHIAVVARASAGEYLCDLGDQWIQPVLIDPQNSAFTPGWLEDFFPGAKVRLQRDRDTLYVHYLFPDGGGNQQTYDLRAISDGGLERACAHSQGLLRKPLVEILVRHPGTGELGAWEFSRFRSLWRLPSGHRAEPNCVDLAEWANRIVERTRMSSELVTEALRLYAPRIA